MDKTTPATDSWDIGLDLLASDADRLKTHESGQMEKRHD
jgi:hypothetical protein